MADIVGGITEKELKSIDRKIALIGPHTGCVQIDFIDNTIIPGETFHDLEKLAPVIRAHADENITFEAHLMVTHPETYVKPLAEMGFTTVISQVESDAPREFIAEARAYELEVGLGVDADTDIEVVEPFLEDIDLLLIMTVEAGASGREFRPELLEKVRAVRRNLPDLPIEVDGGINPDTIKVAADAGATRFLSTSFIAKHPNSVSEAVAQLRESAGIERVFIGSSD